MPFDLFGSGVHLSLRLFGTYLLENSTTSSTGITTDRAGQVNLFALPKKKATANLSYNRDALTAFVQLRYIGPGVYDTQNGIGTNYWILADNSVGAIAYLDTRVSWKIKVSDSTLELYASGNNLTDRAPPVLPSYSAAVAAPAQFNAGLYDVLGRSYAFGVNVRF